MGRTSYAVMLIIVTAALAAAPAASVYAERQLGTVGPPPRQDPQRQTSAESFPPLPLPVTPLRRSEPKAEPSPPLFIGKLAYGDTQDYMPNPGDVDNLLRHVRYQLDAWYGWQMITIDELVAMHEAQQPCQIPLLYITGYSSFSFTPAQRQALREYLLDGGTLLGDATLGSAAFAESFRSEMQAMFPRRSFEMLPLDHPILRAYYAYSNVEYFTIDRGAHTRVQSPPRLWGMNIAARTAVILSPFDMTCGWDEFYAPPAPRRGNAQPTPTMAMMPADAIRMGVNIVAYTAAQRRFARVQAQTRTIDATQHQQRAAVPLALLRHHGDWNPDPNSLHQLIRLAAQHTSIPVDFELRPIDARLEHLIDTPVVFMTAMDDPRLTDAEIHALQRHLVAGGFLFINNTSGFARFDREARALLARLIPDEQPRLVPPEHPIYNAIHKLTELRHVNGQSIQGELQAVFIDERAAALYSPTDALGMLKGVHDPYANAYDRQSAQKLMLNILCHAMGVR